MMFESPAQIFEAVQNGVDINQIVMQMIQQHPAFQKAARFVNGKTPDQIRDSFYREAQFLGINPQHLSQRLGIPLPE